MFADLVEAEPRVKKKVFSALFTTTLRQFKSVKVALVQVNVITGIASSVIETAPSKSRNHLKYCLIFTGLAVLSAVGDRQGPTCILAVFLC